MLIDPIQSVADVIKSPISSAVKVRHMKVCTYVCSNPNMTCTTNNRKTLNQQNVNQSHPKRCWCHQSLIPPTIKVGHMEVCPYSSLKPSVPRATNNMKMLNQQNVDCSHPKRCQCHQCLTSSTIKIGHMEVCTYACPTPNMKMPNQQNVDWSHPKRCRCHQEFSFIRHKGWTHESLHLHMSKSQHDMCNQHMKTLNQQNVHRSHPKRCWCHQSLIPPAIKVGHMEVCPYSSSKRNVPCTTNNMKMLKQQNVS